MFEASVSKKKKSSAYMTAVYSSDLKELWHTSYTLPNASGAFSYGQARPGNDGSIIITGHNRKKKGQPSLDYASVYYMDQANKRPKELRLRFGNDFVENVYVAYNKNSEPLVIGFYKDSKSKKGYDGILHARLHPDGSLTEIRKKEFSKDFITAVFTEKEKRKADRKESRKGDIAEDKSFRFTEFYATTDGGYVGIAESHYKTSYSQQVSTGSGMSMGSGGFGMGTRELRKYDVHHYEDLAVFKFDAEGTIVAMNKIAKNTTYTVPDGSSEPYEQDYASISLGNYAYILFNDDQNWEENEHRKHNKSGLLQTTYIVRIGNDGSLKRDVLIDRKEIGAFNLDVHSNLYKASDSKFVFLASPKTRFWNKSIKLGQITVTD
jgi:hypothetical protein